MSKYNRICTLKEHEIFQASHLCMVEDCTLEQKWCCTECITQKIHNHGQQDLAHIIPWVQLIKQIKQNFIKFQHQHLKDYVELLQKGLQQCKQLFEILQEYQTFLLKEIKNIEKDNQVLNKIIQDLSEEIFVNLDDQKISELINFNKNQFLDNSKFLIKPIQNIDKKLSEFQSLIKDYQIYWYRSNIQSDIKQFKYQIKEIDFTNSRYNTSQISNNEQFLAYGGDDSLLKIYDLKKYKIVKEFALDSYIYAIQFTIDSSQLFVGSYRGYVYGYDVLNHFKLIFKQLIHQNQVCNIRVILNNSLITCSYDKTIIKTDIATKQQIFKLIHQDLINAIDYNDIDNMIISVSHDKSIILWDCSIQSKIIIKEKSHPQQVRQIQLINNNQNLLSLDSNHSLYKWKIDLINKDLKKIQEFSDSNNIQNFYQINQDQNLLLICKKYVKILDNQGNTINLIQHQSEDFDSWLIECRQLDNGRFIHIKTNCKKYVLKNQKNQCSLRFWSQKIVELIRIHRMIN